MRVSKINGYPNPFLNYNFLSLGFFWEKKGLRKRWFGPFFANLNPIQGKLVSWIYVLRSIAIYLFHCYTSRTLERGFRVDGRWVLEEIFSMCSRVSLNPVLTSLTRSGSAGTDSLHHMWLDCIDNHLNSIPSRKTTCYSFRFYAHAIAVVHPRIHKCQMLVCDKPPKVSRVCSAWSKISPTRPEHATFESVIFGSVLWRVMLRHEKGQPTKATKTCLFTFKFQSNGTTENYFIPVGGYLVAFSTTSVLTNCYVVMTKGSTCWYDQSSI